MTRERIVILMVVFLAVFCTAKPPCPPGIWCARDETSAKLARRNEIARDRALNYGFRRIKGIKRGDEADKMDIEREFEEYFL